MKSRRDLLTGIGAAGVVTIAGCSSSGDGENGDNRSSNQSNSSVTPETVTKRFWEALINEEYETANEILHSGSLNYPLDESDISIANMEVVTVEEVTYSEASERIALSSEEELDEAIEDRTNTNDYTIVYVELSDGETITPVVEDNGKLQTVYLR